MKKFFYVLFISFLFMGCTQVVDKYKVTIDAVANPEVRVKPSTYVIKPMRENIDELKFQRESEKLSVILNKKGYKKVKYENLAEQIIYFDYGIEIVKEETEFYTEPDISWGLSWGYPFRHRGFFYSPFWTDIRYGTYRTYEKRHRLFKRYIVILSKDQTGKELWRVDVYSIGEFDNLEEIIPILLKASEPYIGKSIDKPINITISEDLKDKEDKKE